jgi:hypothetical protein
MIAVRYVNLVAENEGMSRSKLAELAEIAAGQWGMITTAQATVSRVSPQVVARLAKDGELERLAHGIYRLAGSPPHPHDDLRAAWLALEPRRTASERLAADTAEVVSHRSAAVLHELGDIDADVLEFTAAVRHQTRRRDIRIHRGSVDASTVTLVAGLPVTTPLRTIGDLASARLDRGHLAGVVRDALIDHNLTVPVVAAVLDQHARAYGVTAGSGTALVGLMLDEAGVPQSTIEVAALVSGEAHLIGSGTLQATNSAKIARLAKEIESLEPETIAALQRLLTDPATSSSRRRARGQPEHDTAAPSAASSQSPPNA